MMTVKAGLNLTHLDTGKMTLYEVRYKDGVDLDYFSSREAAEMYLEKYIAKLNARNATPHIPGQRGLPEPFTRDDFEIREKQEQA